MNLHITPHVANLIEAAGLVGNGNYGDKGKEIAKHLKRLAQEIIDL